MEPTVEVSQERQDSLEEEEEINENMRMCFNGFKMDDQEVQLNRVDSDDQNVIEVNHDNNSQQPSEDANEVTEIPDDTFNFQLEDAEEQKKSTKSTTYEDRLKQISNTKFKSDKKTAAQKPRQVSQHEFEQSLLLSKKLDSGTS